MAPFAAPVARALAKKLVAPKIDPLAARWAQYCVGYKGAQFMEAGIVYAPYIPLVQTCNLVDPKFVKRFAEAKFRHEYYGKGTICG